MTDDYRRTGPIHFSYGDDTFKLNINDLRLERGAILIVAGDNGSGKTTLLKLLGGVLTPSGSSVVNGSFSDFCRNSVYLHQTPYLFRGSVQRNLLLAGLDLSDEYRREALETVGLEGFGHRKVKSLSGGEAKRVALARAFLSDKEILLLDEPTAHVDKASMLLIEKACRNLARRGRTLVISTHRGGFAYRIADRIIDIRKGRIAVSSLNILKGYTVRESDGYLHFHSGAQGFLVPNRDGDYQVAVIAAEDIILSRRPLESSARNCLEGKLNALIPRPDGLITAEIDCGIPLRSLVTESAIDDLKLAPGEPIFATFKASSVSMY